MFYRTYRWKWIFVFRKSPQIPNSLDSSQPATKPTHPHGSAKGGGWRCPRCHSTSGARRICSWASNVNHTVREVDIVLRRKAGNSTQKSPRREDSAVTAPAPWFACWKQDPVIPIPRKAVLLGLVDYLAQCRPTMIWVILMRTTISIGFTLRLDAFNSCSREEIGIRRTPEELQRLEMRHDV